MTSVVQRGREASAAVEVRGVSKRFVMRGPSAGDLRELFRNARRSPRVATPPGEFWALRDIDFEVPKGSAVGIVGHNGSGKSTLLKLLTGIIKPSEGHLHVAGRIGALIEVGAGFHPDLSGRENIYLNGSILGLSRREISRRFDSIVAFAGLEQFIDTPVKRYSSGMYMRLGFSVAAHTDPEVLLIDEVLAVGDTQFQNRCLRKLKEFAAEGGTVIFVSHGMGQVADICETCIWLDHGQMRYIGPTESAIGQYMEMVRQREEEEFQKLFPQEWARRQAEAEEERRRREEAEAAAEEERRREQLRAAAGEAERLEALLRRKARPGDPLASRLLGVTLRDPEGVPAERFHAGEPMSIEIAYRFGRSLPEPVFGVDIFRDDGLHMFTTSNYDHELSLRGLPREGSVVLNVPLLSLNEGRYRVQVNLFADCRQPQWWAHPEDENNEAAHFSVSAGRFANGCAFLPSRWEVPAEAGELVKGGWL